MSENESASSPAERLEADTRDVNDEIDGPRNEITNRDQFEKYPLHSHGNVLEYSYEGESETHAAIAKVPAPSRPSNETREEPSSFELFIYEQINKYAWSCTTSVQDEAEAKYILLSEFMCIGLASIKVTHPEFNKHAASKKATDLFRKNLPPYLITSPKMGFDMFNLAMIDLVTEALPHASLRERVLWLGKVYNRITYPKQNPEGLNEDVLRLAETTCAFPLEKRIDGWIEHYQPQFTKNRHSRRGRRPSVSDLVDLQHTVTICSLFEILDHDQVSCDPEFQIRPRSCVCGKEGDDQSNIEIPVIRHKIINAPGGAMTQTEPKEELSRPVTADRKGLHGQSVKMIYMLEQPKTPEQFSETMITELPEVQIHAHPRQVKGLRPKSCPPLSRSVVQPATYASLSTTNNRRAPFVKQSRKSACDFWVSLPSGKKYPISIHTPTSSPQPKNFHKNSSVSEKPLDEFGMDANVLAEYEPRNRKPDQFLIIEKAGSRRPTLMERPASANKLQWPTQETEEWIGHSAKIFLFGELNKFIWYCVPTIKEDTELSYILLADFLHIVVSCMKCKNPDFNEKLASKKAAELFKKYMPPFLAVSTTMEFEMFNMAMMDITTEARPQDSVREQLQWLAKIYNRITRKIPVLTIEPGNHSPLKFSKSDDTFLLSSSERIDEWIRHYKADANYLKELDEDFRLSSSNLLDVPLTVKTCKEFEILEHAEVFCDPQFQNIVQDPLCGLEEQFNVELSIKKKRSLTDLPHRYATRHSCDENMWPEHQKAGPFASNGVHAQKTAYIFRTNLGLGGVSDPSYPAVQRVRRCWLCGGVATSQEYKSTSSPKYLEQVLLKPTVVTFSAAPSTAARAASRQRR